MPRARPIPQLTLGGIATTRRLRDEGVAKWRLETRAVHRVLRGVVASTTEPVTWQLQVRAAQTLLRPGRFVSRRTAARLLGIPGPSGTDLIELGAIRPARAPQRPELQGHQIGPGVLLALPTGPEWLPHPADVWGLLGAVSSVEALVVAGDALVSGATRWDEPLATRGELADAVQRFRRCVGAGRLAAALEKVRVGVESPAETLVRLRIVGAGLPEPVVSCPVRVGGRILRADLGYPQWRIAIEYDGAYHFTSGLEQVRRDADRAEAMRAAGWRVLRLTALDLREDAAFLGRLRAAIRDATARPGPARLV